MVYVLYILNGYVNKKCTIFGFTCPLTLAEASIALDRSNRNKSPGVDRLTVEFYKVKYDRPGECSPEKDCLR